MGLETVPASCWECPVSKVSETKSDPEATLN